MTSNKRDITLDLVKGICIILMVIGHSGAPIWIHDFIYMFHMPCFFIVSGYLIKEKYVYNLKIFFKRKFKSIWWVFVKWTIIFVLLHNLFYNLGIYEVTYTYKEIALKILKSLDMNKTEQLLSGFWFLKSLMIASIVSILYYRFIGMQTIKLVIGIVCLILISVLLKHYEIRSLLYLNQINVMSTAYFMSGSLLRELTPHLMSRRFLIASIAFLSLIVGTITIPTSIPDVKDWQIVPYFLISFLVSAALIEICRYDKLHNICSWIARIGSRTLDILIFHLLAFKLVSFIKIQHLGLNESKMSDFPVIYEANEWYWLAYSFIGVGVSLLLVNIINCIHHLIISKSFTFYVSNQDK